MATFALAPRPAGEIDTTWFIDVGPFFDRFGAAKMNVLTSTSVIAQAVVKDAQIRKWIDLKHPSVAAGIDALMAVGVSGVTADLKAQILNTAPTPDEGMALRKLYFGG